MDLPRLLHQIILKEGNKCPGAPAIQSPGKKVLSYHGLSQHLQSTTLQLSRLGIRKGDCLGLVLPNGPEMATAFLATSAVCICAPLNPAYPLDEFKFCMKDLHIKALIMTPGDNHPASRAATELGIPIIDLIADQHTAGLFSLTCDLPIDKTPSELVLAEVDDVALVLHTSGTTSRPKIVPLTHRNIFYSAHNIAEAYALMPPDRCLNMMPLFHIHGLIGAVAASLVSGASVQCAPGFISGQVLGWLSQLAPTWYTAVPAIHQAILEQVHRQPDSAELVHLRFIRSCSSPLPPLVARDLETVFNAPVLEAYGMTEAAHQIASNPLPPSARKFGSVGRPTGTTQVAIMDVHGNTLPEKSAGEICIRGENVISGYKNNPADNATSFVNGWLRTGDLGYLDEDGYLVIQGRLKELINRGGEKISPREVDEVLLNHPAVRQAATFAIPHSTLGEDIAAAVVLKDDSMVSMQELRQFVFARLAEHKVPRQIVFVSEIPKGSTGKVQRIGLAEKLKDELETGKTVETPGESLPRTKVEAQILSIWQTTLDNLQIGIQDDLLALGTDSIMTARILMSVNELFKINLSLGDVFNAPTIALLADLVLEKQNNTI